MAGLRIVSNEAAHYLYQGDKIIATGSRELCEAVQNGTVPEYIEKSRQEREANGIGEYRGQTQKPATKARKRPAKGGQETLDL